jgi:hypothetical protein
MFAGFLRISLAALYDFSLIFQLCLFVSVCHSIKCHPYYIQNYSNDCSGSVLWRAATMKIGSGCHIYRPSHNKVHEDAEIRSINFKGPRPFKIKKKPPAEQWEIIGYPLIPLLTYLSSRCTMYSTLKS